VWLASIKDSGWLVLSQFRNWPNWMPGLRQVTQADQESPARGTVLHVSTAGATMKCCIDLWDPPQSLQFSMDVAGGEIAYGFQIRCNSGSAEMLISMQIERTVQGLFRLIAFYLRWRQQRLARVILSNLAYRIGLENKVQA
jgi:hypothetical protein